MFEQIKEPEHEDIPTNKGKREVFRNEKAKRLAENRDVVPLIKPKHTIEVEVKPRPTIEQLETIEKMPESQKKPKSKPKAKTSEKKDKDKKQKSFKPQGLEQLSGDSILIITEKPQAATKIAAALSEGDARQLSDGGVSFYEFHKNSQDIIVACAVGHLFSLSQDVKGSNYPIFEVSWKPNFEVKKKDFTKKYYSLLAKLVRRAKEIIIATDYDVEGELIGYNIARFIGRQKDAKRMKFSSLTKDELEEAFNNLQPTINWGQAIAGETRHFIDWYYGINLSRALMSSIKSCGKFRIMSIGRVQGPALKMIVEKEREIEKFKSIPFWKIFIDVVDKKDKTNTAKLRHVKDIFDEGELSKFEKLKGKIAEVKTEKTSQNIEPPHPFDLTTLQTESYKFFGINPARTLEIAQRLYLAGLISYPRTSSQKIPEAINPKAILKKLSKNFSQTSMATRSIPVEGKKSDPAHPSIYPTGEFQGVSEDDEKVYELIVRRFISCFCESALVENKTITATADNLTFKDRGAEIKERGWMAVYQANLQEKELRDMNGPADILKVDVEKDETKPPRRFSPASIISELEKRGLGTKATRANIIETLYDRNYVADNKSIKATPLGLNLIKTLEKYSPIIIDDKLTRNMEKDLESMQTIKKDLEGKEKEILDKAKSSLIAISEDFHKKEGVIGQELIKATEANWAQQNKDNELVLCPKCKVGMLTIKFSPRFKRSFVACNKYPDCKTTFSLPPYGMIKKLSDNKPCSQCGFPLLMSLRKGKRPWIFCFNPECPSRKSKEADQEANQESGEEAKETEDGNEEESEK